jgi:adenosylcobinamide kinase/adenosylcobinamide-phosphate guanylyltransferase
MRLAVPVQVRLVGTGPADGWPSPGCICVGCRAAQLSGETRGPLAAVVDEQVLLSAGSVEAAPGYEVEPVRAAWSVTGPTGTRLLWAPRDGMVPEGPSYDAVFLGLNDLTAWPLELAALGRSGAVRATTYVAAIGIGHDLAPTAELARTLRGWGADLPADGAVVDLPAPAPKVRAPRVLVLGGARSGKSAYAEQRLSAEPAVVYVATAPPRPDDAEWAARVQAHIARRPASWETVERADVAELLDVPTAVLVDDLGLWLTRLLDAHDAWEGPVPPAVDMACTQLVAAWARRTSASVMVAPDVGSGVVPATSSGRRFRDLLGGLTSRLAQQTDEVVQVVAGLPRWLR